LASDLRSSVVQLRRVTKSEELVEPKRRETSVSAREARDAARLVRAINDRIGQWQAESIRLATAAERMRQSGRYEPGLVEAIQVMISLVERQQHAFCAQIAEVPGGIAQHSRIHDTQRAMAMVVARLEAALPS